MPDNLAACRQAETGAALAGAALESRRTEVAIVPGDPANGDG